MSLSSATNRNTYTGVGSVSTYAYTFRIFDEDNLVVVVRNTSNVETTLTITTDYTVSGVGLAGGGNVVLVSAAQAWLTNGKLTTGYVLIIRRVLDLVQNTNIRNQGTFYPETHEDVFDYLTMVDQQEDDDIDRAVKLPATIPPATFNPELPANIVASAGSSILVNSAGTGFVMGPTMFSLYIQSAQPANPSGIALAFWFDLGTGQMNIWCISEWRTIA